MFSSSRFMLARAVGIVALLLVMAVWSQAQTAPSTPSPSIQQVLAGVRANIATTIATLPNVECQEQAHSASFHNGKLKHEVTLNSTLQARRMNDKTGDFAEERIPAPGGSINGKPTKPGKKYGLPFYITDGFGTTYEWSFSPKIAACLKYKLVTGTAAESHWVGLQVTPSGADPAHCGTPNAGMVVTFWLDPATYQIRRFQIVNPHAMVHLTEKIFISKYEPRYMVGTTDYRLVTLGQKQYLLPEKIHTTVWEKEQNSPDEMTYDAQYSGCHMFGSTVRIVDSSINMIPTPTVPAH